MAPIKSCLQLFSEDNEAISRFGPPVTNNMKDNLEEGQSGLTFDNNLKWINSPPAKPTDPIVLTVKFIGKPLTQNPDLTLQKIKTAAKIWEQYSNIKFDYKGDNDSAMIRCGFVKGSGHWSYCGQDNLLISAEKNTMNLDFTDRDNDSEIRGTTLHEFGHAMGCVHEQVNPDISKQTWKWNEKAIYDYFMDPNGVNKWSKETVDIAFNNFKPMLEADTSHTNWDKFSIMQYEISKKWTIPELAQDIPRNQDLTQFDKDFIGKMYPKKKA